MNVHKHKIEIYTWENNIWIKNFELLAHSFTKSIKKNSDYLYAIKCRQCNEIYNDYTSNFQIKEANNFFSLFNNNNKSLIGNSKFNDDVIFFTFYEFKNYFLIGTKNEIISFISEKFNSLENEHEVLKKKMYSTNEQNKSVIEKRGKYPYKGKTDKDKIENKQENLNKEKNSVTNDLNKEKSFEELIKENKEKESMIQYLKNDNMNLINNLNELKNDLYIKENEIKKIKDSLFKEKNINQNIICNLNDEKDINRKLTDKLDNIVYESNENVNKILGQFDAQKKINQNLQIKYSELEKQVKIKRKQNEELKSQLEHIEEEELKKYKSENFGLKFKSDRRKGEYDIILDINSMKSLVKGGWKIIYNQKGGKHNYLKKQNDPTIVVGVIGNKNTGKTFLLEKLSGYSLPNGFNVGTKGLGVRYDTTLDHNVIILDSIGQETPLLKIENSKIDEKDDSGEEEITENDEGKKSKKIKDNNEDIEAEKNNEFEQYSRDKLITEFFLEKFIIWKSNIIILVVGNISLTEQKLIYRVKQEAKNLDKNKQIFVIHNLKEYSSKEQVEEYIENTLKKLCKTELFELNMLNINCNFDNKYFYDKYYMEKGENISHFIFVNEFSDNHNYYNTPVINFIQKEIEVVKYRNEFSLIDDCKEFLVKIADEIMEENIKLENLITEEGEKFDKILLKNTIEINLKNYAVFGFESIFKNDSDEPNYSCYIDIEKNKLYIKIELPGGGKNIRKKLEVKGFFIFLTIEGEKNGDKQLEEDENNEIKKLFKICNKRKRKKFKIHLEIPNGLIQIFDAGKFIYNEYSKGILTVEYNIKHYYKKRSNSDDNEEIFVF